MPGNEFHLQNPQATSQFSSRDRNQAVGRCRRYRAVVGRLGAFVVRSRELPPRIDPPEASVAQLNQSVDVRRLSGWWRGARARRPAGRMDKTLALVVSCFWGQGPIRRACRSPEGFGAPTMLNGVCAPGQRAAGLTVDQHRDFGVGQHFLGFATQKEAAYAAPSV